jgi:hypothetical protein
VKSIIPVDDTLTIDTFRRQNSKAEAILRANNLPNPTCPYSTVANQLYNNDYQAMTRLSVSLEYSETKQVKGVQAQLNDRDMANVVAEFTPAEFTRYSVLGSVPGCLIVPAEFVDDVKPVSGHTQQAVLRDFRLSEVRKDLRADMTELEFPRIDSDFGETQDNWYWKPTGDVTIQVEGEAPLEIPCFPESVNDSTSATWSQEMTTYQHYEPQNTYNKSGPRVVSCTFKIHRAMWDGNQDSGKSEELVAYMQSACYPDYDTQASEPPRVTLIIGKSVRIVGILTTMETTYSGPIGPDNKYDCVDISISITEESDNVLSTEAVRSGLAGWR